jgi:hypothetical protein
VVRPACQSQANTQNEDDDVAAIDVGTSLRELSPGTNLNLLGNIEQSTGVPVGALKFM